MKSNERRLISVVKDLNIEAQKEDEVIQPFSRIGSLQKLGSPSLICRIFKGFRKVFLNPQKWT